MTGLKFQGSDDFGHWTNKPQIPFSKIFEYISNMLLFVKKPILSDH